MRFLPLASPGTPTARAARPLRAVPWRQTALFLCVLATAGCASLAPTDGALPAVAVPPAWSAGGNGTEQGATATSLAQWWQRFDDAVLTSLVEQALRANTSVRPAQAPPQQARAQGDVQSAGLLPRVGAPAAAPPARQRPAWPTFRYRWRPRWPSTTLSCAGCSSAWPLRAATWPASRRRCRSPSGA